mmetsp:Transcript_18318/g.35896  ORF Transcript_18318/g.35896 Transcript_18318/m.35896 type:complete len:92 (-) Transcript_18318:8-283(-)
MRSMNFDSIYNSSVSADQMQLTTQAGLITSVAVAVARCCCCCCCLFSSHSTAAAENSFVARVTALYDAGNQLLLATPLFHMTGDSTKLPQK